MKRATWKETDRREVGVVTGEGKAGANFTLLYLVTECRKVDDGLIEWRERLVRGKALYQTTQDTVSAATLLEVVAKGVKALTNMARMEQHATSRRKS